MSGTTKRYKLCLEYAQDNQKCTIGYSAVRPSCNGTLRTDKNGCYCCDNPNGTACIREMTDDDKFAM